MTELGMYLYITLPCSSFNFRLCSIAAIQARNEELCRAKLYSGQATHDPKTTNVRYVFLQSDSSRLYQKYSRAHGIDVTQPAQYNIHNWLDPQSPEYKSEFATAVFYYQARAKTEERLRICIQTPDMEQAAWKYAHQSQLVLDGTFGICNSRVLLFIALGVDAAGKGVPLAFFLFSATTGNCATHAGYDVAILRELLEKWRDHQGSRDGVLFAPRIAITDTDTKERAALILVWPDIWLVLCKFHIRQCWTNKRKRLLRMGRTISFPKVQIESRLRALEDE